MLSKVPTSLNGPRGLEVRGLSIGLLMVGMLFGSLAFGQSSPQCGLFNYCLGASCAYTSAAAACTAAALSAHPGAQVHIDTDAQNGQVSWSCSYTYVVSAGSGTDGASGPVQAIQSSCSSDQPPPSSPAFSLPHCTPDSSTYCVLIPLGSGS